MLVSKQGINKQQKKWGEVAGDSYLSNVQSVALWSSGIPSSRCKVTDMRCKTRISQTCHVKFFMTSMVTYEQCEERDQRMVANPISPNFAEHS